MKILNTPTSTVAALNNQLDLSFVSDSQGVAAVREGFGAGWLGNDYDAYFVACGEGEYTEIWGMCGSIPYNSKLVSKLL